MCNRLYFLFMSIGCDLPHVYILYDHTWHHSWIFRILTSEWNGGLYLLKKQVLYICNLSHLVILDSVMSVIWYGHFIYRLEGTGVTSGNCDILIVDRPCWPCNKRFPMWQLDDIVTMIVILKRKGGRDDNFSSLVVVRLTSSAMGIGWPALNCSSSNGNWFCDDWP